MIPPLISLAHLNPRRVEFLLERESKNSDSQCNGRKSVR